QPNNTANLLIGFSPNFAEAILIEQRWHIEDMLCCKREVTTKHRNFCRRCHGIVVGMHGINRTRLKRTEKFASWYNLVSVIEFDLKLAVRCFIDRIDNWLGHMLTKGSTSIGLET